MKKRNQNSKFIPGKTQITYGAAIFKDEERKAIESVLDRNWWALNGQGQKFESELADFVGKKYCVLMNSGSSALLVATEALELPRGSLVAIPAVTFPTAFNSLIRNGLTPMMIDSDPTTLNLNYDELEIAFKKGAKAAIVVHIAGNPVDMVRVMSLARKYKAQVIEDNCDGFGGVLGNRKVGSFGDLSCISMYAGHIINMGEGGAVFTDIKSKADKMKSLRDWGRAGESDQRNITTKLPKDYPSRYVYTQIGYNLRPLELQAAMGRVQLKRISSIVKTRMGNYSKLWKIFSDRPGIKLMNVVKDAYPAWFSFPFLCEDRASLISYFETKNIETRPIFAGNILRQPAYDKVKVKKVSRLQGADVVMKQGMFIGLHPLIPNEAFQYIEEVVDQYYHK